jgi:hypothetical protein
MNSDYNNRAKAPRLTHCHRPKATTTRLNIQSHLITLLVSWLFCGAQTASAFYNPSTGRWLRRDPVGEKGGANLYAAVHNDEVDAADVLGRWEAAQHRSLTQDAIWASYEALITTSRCQDRIRHEVVDGNLDQDGWGIQGSLYENARHYNRDKGQTGAQGEAAYQAYLAQERKDFEYELKKPSTSHCRRALFSLGRLSHSWQDFFMHAIRKDGKGGNENSSFPGWTAWSVGVTGTPDNTQYFYPSSFSVWGGGEHPSGIGNEPLLSNSPEFAARYNAALDYSQSKIQELLLQWMTSCRCACEESSALSWTTTELPLR